MLAADLTSAVRRAVLASDLASTVGQAVRYRAAKVAGRNVVASIQKAIADLPSMPGYGFVMWDENTKHAHIVLGDSDEQARYGLWEETIGNLPGINKVTADAESWPKDREWLRIERTGKPRMLKRDHRGAWVLVRRAKTKGTARREHGHALAEFYAQSWNVYAAAGIEVPESELEQAGGELARSGYMVKWDEAVRQWVVCVGGRVRRSKDAAGHEHRGTGEGGGQFTSSGEAGAGKEADGTKPKAEPSHMDRLKAAHAAHTKAKEEHKAVRQEAFEGIKEKAQDALDKADEHAQIIDAEAYNLAWDTTDEEQQPYTDLETATREYDADAPTKDRYEKLRDIEWHAKEAMRVKQKTGGEDEVSEKDAAENKSRLKAIVKAARKARQALREYAQHRQDLKAIKEGTYGEDA